MVTGLLYTMQVTKKKNNQLDFNYLENCILSIQISLDGFSFCILNTDLNEIIALSSFDFFDKNTSPEMALRTIEKIYAEEEVLSKEFKSVNLTIKNNLNTFVPAELFDPELASKYLKHTIKVLKNDFIAYDELASNKLVNVYVPYVNMTNYFLDHYGPFEYQHTATVLVNSLLKINAKKGGTNTYVHFSKAEMELTVLTDDQLRLYNAHKITTVEDVVYFILFTYEQLALDVKHDKLIVLGAIDEQHINYTYLTKYLNRIEFLNYEYTYSAELLTHIENHQHFVVLNQF